MTLRFGLLGAGSWGTTVASLIARNAPITIWARDPETAEEIQQRHTNEKYLPGAKLPEALQATSNIEEAVAHADVIVMGVPSQGFRGVLETVKQSIRAWVPVISLSKGLELDTRLRMTQIINDVLPGHPIGVLTGPNLAAEIMQGQAAASVLAMEDEIILSALQPLFRTGLFRVYTNTDVVGCELGGAFKNVIAIGVGMGDGQGAGENTRSALITRGLAEVTRLGVAMGGRPETFPGLAGMGDMIATCTSPKSRNHQVGVALGQGRTIEEIMNDMFMVAEGVRSAPVMMQLAEDYEIQMPITEDVCNVIQGKATPTQAFRGLLRRTAGAEADPG